MGWMAMGWWPFGKRTSKFTQAGSGQPEKIIAPTSRQRLDELRQICDGAYEQPEAGRILLRENLIEWDDALTSGELTETLHDGLSRRARLLIRADDDEWRSRIEDEAFWKPGWRLDVEG